MKALIGIALMLCATCVAAGSFVIHMPPDCKPVTVIDDKGVLHVYCKGDPNIPKKPKAPK